MLALYAGLKGKYSCAGSKVVFDTDRIDVMQNLVEPNTTRLETERSVENHGTSFPAALATIIVPIMGKGRSIYFPASMESPNLRYQSTSLGSLNVGR